MFRVFRWRLECRHRECTKPAMPHILLPTTTTTPPSPAPPSPPLSSTGLPMFLLPSPSPHAHCVCVPCSTSGGAPFAPSPSSDSALRTLASLICSPSGACVGRGEEGGGFKGFKSFSWGLLTAGVAAQNKGSKLNTPNVNTSYRARPLFLFVCIRRRGRGR